MSKPWLKLWVGLAVFLAWGLIKTEVIQAQSTTPKILISQLKITSSSGQFATLYNNTDTAVDLEKIQLQYFNNYDLSKATSGKLIPLSGILGPRSFAIVNDGPINMCYQALVVSVSLNLSSTSGFLQVSHYPLSSGPQVMSVLDDYIGWSKTSAPGAQTLPSNSSAFLQRQSLNGVTTGSGPWSVVMPDPLNPCLLSTTLQADSSFDSFSLDLLPAVPPPAMIISLSAASGVVGASNNGLMVPVITEILPNPASPLNDAEGEFIEIYNGNDRVFDLSGYGVQTSLSGTRIYKFPAGTSLAPKAFSIFTSADYSFTLSNSGGQVKLVDISGKVIAQSDPYSNAKEGQSWALAGGKWYWTNKPSAGIANVIDQNGSAASSGSKSSSAVRSASTVGSTNTPPGTTTASQSDPLHPATLAVVGGAVILYAGYEYRNDVANQLHRLRRYREARRASGQSD